MKNARRLCLELAVVLTAFAAFLLPLKFGGVSGLAEVPGNFPGDLWEWLLFSSYPTEFFTILCGALLALTLLGGAVRMPGSREARWMLWLWGAALPLAVLPGFVNTAIMDYAYAALCHWLGIGAWCWATALLISDDPRRKKLFVGALMAGAFVSVLAGWRLYFWGFAETRRHFAAELASGEIGEQLKIKLEDTRVYATFTSCNSFAGFLILAGAAFAVFAGKFGERFEPRKVSKWLFMGAAAVLTFGLLPLTHSRGALLCALFAALGAFMCSRLPRAAKLAALAVCLAAMIGGAWHVHRAGRGFSSGAERLDYLRTASSLTAAHPVCGAGCDGFYNTHMRVKRTRSDESAHDPHNLVASFSSQGGVLPGILALAALLLPLWALFRRYRTSDPWSCAVSWGCAASALHMLMELDYQSPALPAAFWLLAMTVLTFDAAPAAVAGTPLKRYPPVAAALAAASALAVGIFVLYGDLAFADLSALIRPAPGERWTPPAEPAIQAALAKVRKSGQHLPFALELLADYRYNYRRDPVAAEKLLRESLALGGERPGVYDRLGEVAFARGDFAAAGRHWRRAHELFPRKYPPAVEALSRRWIAVFGRCWNRACGKLFPAKYPEVMPPPAER